MEVITQVVFTPGFIIALILIKQKNKELYNGVKVAAKGISLIH